MWTSVLSIFLVLLLHFLKPEQEPAWHMLSEYAIGTFGWVMQLAFLTWSLSSISLAVALWPVLHKIRERTGVLLLLLSAMAIILAAVFVIDAPTTPPDQLSMHGRLHGFASMIGVPVFPIAAVLISRSLARMLPARREKIWISVSSHFTWISLIIMVATVVQIFALNDGKFGEGSTVGWANRIYWLACCMWLLVIAKSRQSV
jgi:hypothetical protein